MSSPQVAQSSYLADMVERWVNRYTPSSVALLGCSGGNGCDRLSPDMVRRVAGIDINPEYIDVMRKRYDGRFESLELITGDIASCVITIEPVDLAVATLLFEYVDPRAALHTIRRILRPGGMLGVILQMPSADHPAVTPTTFGSVANLVEILTLVPFDTFERLALQEGYTIESTRITALSTGKRFQEVLLRYSKT
jgi:SAM-dependent methyltransferase